MNMNMGDVEMRQRRLEDQLTSIENKLDRVIEFCNEAGTVLNQMSERGEQADSLMSMAKQAFAQRNKVETK